MEQWTARWAHIPKVTGSNPVPATTMPATPLYNAHQGGFSFKHEIMEIVHYLPHIIAILFISFLALKEGISDAKVIKAKYGIKHGESFVFRILIVSIVAFIVTGVYHTVYNLHYLITTMSYVWVLGSIYWILFELTLNIKVGWGLFYTGSTSAIDIILTKIENKTRPWFDIVIKLASLTGSILVYNAL